VHASAHGDNREHGAGCTPSSAGNTQRFERWNQTLFEPLLVRLARGLSPVLWDYLGG